MQASHAKVNDATFDWGLVPAFLAAFEHGSLMAAARATGVSQPTLGRQIARLEQELGAVLFERTGRGLLPTPMAQALAASAHTMQAEADRLWRSARGAQAEVSGVVRVSASQPVAVVLLPPLLARLRERWPALQVTLVVTNTVSNLLRREADIALRMVPPTQGELVARRVGAVPIRACAHADYLRRRGEPRVPEDLLQHDLITDDRTGEVARGFAALGWTLDPARIALRTDDLLAYWAAVRAGLGIGFVSEYLLRTDPTVRPLLPQLQVPPLPIWLTVHREVHTSARIRAVYDFLAQAVPAAL